MEENNMNISIHQIRNAREALAKIPLSECEFLFMGVPCKYFTKEELMKIMKVFNDGYEINRLNEKQLEKLKNEWTKRYKGTLFARKQDVY